MTVQPEQVEAHAAQGYSLLDVARLLGVRQRDLGDAPQVIEAFNEGARRWRANGSPIPPKVVEIVAQKVMVELKRKELTRAELREITGLDYGEINLALESLEVSLLIDHEEDAAGTSHFRASGVESPIAEKRRASAVAPVDESVRLQAEQALKEKMRPRPLTCVECGKPRSNGSGERCGDCYRRKAEANRVRKEQERSGAVKGRPKIEVDLQALEDFLADPDLSMSEVGEKLGITRNTIYTRKDSEPDFKEAYDRGLERRDRACQKKREVLCGCGRPENHGGRCSYRRKISPSITEQLKAESNGHQTAGDVVHARGCELPSDHTGMCSKAIRTLPEIRTPPAIEIAEPIPAEVVTLDKTPDTSMVAKQTTLAEIYSGVRLHQDIQVCASEIANWPRDEIVALIGELSRVADVEVPVIQPTRTKIKFAWPRDFEDDSEDGMMSLVMCYLISLLHDDMEEMEKDAVWVLVKYIKRMQARVEVARSANEKSPQTS